MAYKQGLLNHLPAWNLQVAAKTFEELSSVHCKVRSSSLPPERGWEGSKTLFFSGVFSWMTNKAPEISQIGFSGTRWFKPWPFDPPNVGGHVYSHWKGRVFTIPKRSKKLPGKSVFFRLTNRADYIVLILDVHFCCEICFLGFYWVKRMVRKLRYIFCCFPIFGCSLFVAHPAKFLLWNSHKSSFRIPKKRSSTVFPLFLLRSVRRWIVGTCRRELQVARGAWEMLQGKSWASWGRFYSKNFMLAWPLVGRNFATQNTPPGARNAIILWVFYFEFAG